MLKAGRPSRLVRRRPGEGGMPTRERFPLRRAYGGTSRPDKCLVVKSLDSSLRPVCPSQLGIHRHHHQGVEANQGRPLLGCQFCCPLSRRGGTRLRHHSLSAATRDRNCTMFELLHLPCESVKCYLSAMRAALVHRDPLVGLEETPEGWGGARILWGIFSEL